MPSAFFFFFCFSLFLGSLTFCPGPVSNYFLINVEPRSHLRGRLGRGYRRSGTLTGVREHFRREWENKGLGLPSSKVLLPGQE
jgi:hypothetical protein